MLDVKAYVAAGSMDSFVLGILDQIALEGPQGQLMLHSLCATGYSEYAFSARFA